MGYCIWVSQIMADQLPSPGVDGLRESEDLHRIITDAHQSEDENFHDITRMILELEKLADVKPPLQKMTGSISRLSRKLATISNTIQVSVGGMGKHLHRETNKRIAEVLTECQGRLTRVETKLSDNVAGALMKLRATNLQFRDQLEKGLNDAVLAAAEGMVDRTTQGLELQMDELRQRIVQLENKKIDGRLDRLNKKVQEQTRHAVSLEQIQKMVQEQTQHAVTLEQTQQLVQEQTRHAVSLEQIQKMVQEQTQHAVTLEQTQQLVQEQTQHAVTLEQVQQLVQEYAPTVGEQFQQMQAQLAEKDRQIEELTKIVMANAQYIQQDKYFKTIQQQSIHNALVNCQQAMHHYSGSFIPETSSSS